jgi:hypothetical protein
MTMRFEEDAGLVQTADAQWGARPEKRNHRPRCLDRHALSGVLTVDEQQRAGNDPEEPDDLAAARRPEGGG